MVVNFIIGNDTPTETQFCASIVYADDELNVLDLVLGLSPIPECWWTGE